MNKEGILKLMSQLDKACCVMDQLGYIQDVNEAYENLYQYKKSELVGKHFLLLVPTTVEFQIPLVGDSDVFIHPKRYKVKRKDGSQFYIQSTTYDYFIEGERFRLCVDDFISEIILDIESKPINRISYLEGDQIEKSINGYFDSGDKNFTFLNLKFYSDVTNENTDRYIKTDVKILLKKIFSESSVYISSYALNNYLIFIDDKFELGNLKEKIEKKFFLKFATDKQILNSMFKVGIVLSDDEEHFTFESIYKKSEIARFFAKTNSYSIFSNKNVEVNKEKSSLELELMAKSTLEQFEYFYQPLINKGGLLMGCECLLRWRSPERGLVSPAVFVPILEENKRLIQIEKRLIKKLFMFINYSKKELPYYSINLSALHFKDWEFYDYIYELINIEEFKVGKIVFEITETVLMQNLEFTSEVLVKLKELGFKIAIDDFGVGYSSLIYLKELPIDILKIDKSFISNIHKNPKNKAIVRYIVSMAKTIGLKVVCEGVELKEELDELKSYNVDIYQGYYFDKPVAQIEYYSNYVNNYFLNEEVI